MNSDWQDNGCSDAALAESILNICVDYPDNVVAFELVTALGYLLERYRPDRRDAALKLIIDQLSSFFASLPPHAGEPPGAEP